MTKLMEWLTIGTLVFGVWAAVISGNINSPLLMEWKRTVLWFPVFAVFFFGLSAMFIVLYRVFTFNNCEEAARELQRQISEATADLESKGIELKKTTQ